MELEIKHLAAYLPYTVTYLANTNRCLYVLTSDVIARRERLRTLDEIVLILKPISDIAKDKEFNDLYFSYYDKTEGLLVKKKNETYTRLNQLSYLFENHYDVFGLIENGLAIDINTL